MYVRHQTFAKKRTGPWASEAPGRLAFIICQCRVGSILHEQLSNVRVVTAGGPVEWGPGTSVTNSKIPKYYHLLIGCMVFAEIPPASRAETVSLSPMQEASRSSIKTLL